MAEFDKLRFLQVLREAPERKPLLEKPEYSEYLKTQLFDKLEKDGKVDLRTLDLSAVSLRDLAPEGYHAKYEQTVGGWCQGLNHFFKKAPAACLTHRAFF